MNVILVSLVALAYVGALFLLARWGETHSSQSNWYSRLQPVIYSLALAVYCTSWTFYGSVGMAVQQGWNYLPILLGPAMLFLFGIGFIKKLVFVSKRQNVSSIGDFLASRYGKKQRVAVLVTITAVLATIPYIALQLKAVTLSFNVITGHEPETPAFVQQNASLIVTLLMAFFAILFGTKKLDVTDYQPGVILAVAFESVIKLVALMAVSLLAIGLYFQTIPDFLSAMSSKTDLVEKFDLNNLGANFVTQLLLSMAAVICLPRQFFVVVVQNNDLNQLNWARWIFPGYLLSLCLFIAPIAAAGYLLFQDAIFNADTYVLQLPLYFGETWVAMLVFIGGFSAATAMIIVATIALSTMISNDVVLPMLIRQRYKRNKMRQDFSAILLQIRRLSIVVVLVAAYFYHLAFANFSALTSIGLLAFALVVQFAPGLIGGLFWKVGHVTGFKWGLISGITLWFYTLMVPTLADAGFVSQRLLDSGLLNQWWLRPESLLGLPIDDRLSHGVFISLLVNSLVYIAISMRAEPRLVDRIQASAFVTPVAEPQLSSPKLKVAPLKNTDLKVMLEQFLGPARTYQVFEEFAQQQQIVINDEASPNYRLIEYCERLLAGAIGSASARAMMNSLMEGKHFGLEDIVTFFDETAQALQQNQSILHASLENIEQGISVVDKNLNLVAWNSSYARLFRYPTGALQVGTPVADLIRYNAENGRCGDGKPEEHIRKRLEHMRKGTAHRFQRRRPDGTVIEMWGSPLPDGGFVTTFTDITEHTRDKEALREAKVNLEKRVKERTETISQMNAELLREIDQRRAVEVEVQRAKELAEGANAAKTRFLALASHDILQPLNAARLYVSALQENPDSEDRDTVIDNLNQSLASTEALIATLLEIARLDDGAIVPNYEDFNIAEILTPLINEFGAVTKDKKLHLRSIISNCKVHSDKLYLRRIIQNLLSNAIKYAGDGQVLIGCRRKPEGLLVQILDTGSGIPPEQQQMIFQDFYRLKHHQHKVSGAGLGLGVVSRLSKLLELPLTLESELDAFTRFSVLVPFAKTASAPPSTTVSGRTEASGLPSDIAGMRVFCADDEAANLDALARLLDKWQCKMVKADSSEQAIELAQLQPVPDVILMDYHLNDDYDGLKLIQTLREMWGTSIPAAIVTATHDAGVHRQVQESGINLLHKPLKPAALKALLRHFKVVAATQTEQSQPESMGR